MLVPPCNAAVQLRSESRIRLIAGTRTLQRDYLRRLSDDIFMCCGESCGRCRHFPYLEVTWAHARIHSRGVLTADS